MNEPIVVSHPDPATADSWVEHLRQLLPAADVFADHQVDPPRAARFAVAWTLSDDFFLRYSRLQAVFSTGAGVDSLVRHPGLPRTVPLIRLEDAGMARQMAEYCCHELFRLRTHAAAYEAQQRQAVWRELPPRPYSQLRVGVLGTGVLGQAVALALREFGYPVTVFSRGDRALPVLRQAGISRFHGESQLDPFLQACDVLILLAPLTLVTENLMDAQRLARLPAGAWLINVARGALVDDEALLAALDSGHLAGATLDVFRHEPLSADHPFWHHPRIRLTPHMSAPTLVQQSAAQVADKIRMMHRGIPVTGMVERDRGY